MPSAFPRAVWAVTAATLAGPVAMLLYPGGTARDHATVGYTITGNFLSDLGMTVAYDGQPNRIGAALFVASIGLLIIGMGGALGAFVRLYAANRRARPLAYAAALTGAVNCVCFIGVALAPENRAMSVHVAFTLAAFRILPVVGLLLTLAAHFARATPRRTVNAWAVLTAVLAAYAVMLQGGAWTATAAGFAAQVIAQKVVATVMIAVMVWQCHDATKLTAPPAPVGRRTRPT